MSIDRKRFATRYGGRGVGQVGAGGAVLGDALQGCFAPVALGRAVDAIGVADLLNPTDV